MLMAEIGKTMSRFDIESLQETLSVQEQLIEKLYNELDEETEASASAASETLSMILRLQSEKAAEEMEAEQYKRFVEEKMSHAEESLSILQELIDQKQMEIAELDYHARAYRYKLVSMGYDDDIAASDIEFHENLDGKMSFQSIGRSRSDPNIPLKYANMKKGEKISPKRDLNDVSTVDSIGLYCEQIGKLEERVKQIAGANYTKLSSLPASKRSSCNNFLEHYKEMYLVQHQVNKSDNEAAASRSASPPNVLDVFEVPRADKDFVPKEAEKRLVKDETDCHKKYLVPMQHLEICPTTSATKTAEIHHVNKTFEIAEIERQYTRQESDRNEELMLLHDIKEKLNLAPLQLVNKLHRVGEAASPTTSASETAEIRRVNRTTFEIPEVERQRMRQEPDRHEELMLLHEIKEQLNLVPMQHDNKIHRVGEVASPTTSASGTAEIRHDNRTAFEIPEVERQRTRQEPDKHKEIMLLHDIKEQLNLVPMQYENKIHRVGEAASPTTSAPGTAEICRFNRTTFEIPEVERQRTRQEPDRHEELMLLHDIKEQLNLVSVQYENKIHRVGEAASPTTSASEKAEIHRVNRTMLEIPEVEIQRTRQETDRHEELMLLHYIKEQLNLVPMQHENKLYRVGEAASPTTSDSETAEIRRVNRMMFETTEAERQCKSQEPNRHDELMLLREIKEQLNLMRSDIKSWKNNKSPPRDEPSVVSLTEVMVCFWL